MTNQNDPPPSTQHLKSFLEVQEREVVVLRYDHNNHLSGYGVHPLSEIVAELHLNGFSKSLEEDNKPDTFIYAKEGKTI